MNYKFRAFNSRTNQFTHFDIKDGPVDLLNECIDIWTGFVDKNGREVYVNDYIVKSLDAIYGDPEQLMCFNNKVFAIPGCFWTENHEYLHEHTDITSAAPNVLPDLVVIGNIYTGAIK